MLIVVAGTSSTYAETSSSPNYSVSETQFSSGDKATSKSCSGSFCANVTIGDMAVGGKSPNYTTSFGSLAAGEPSIEVIVDPGESNLGVLSTERTATKTMVVRIRSFLGDGYMLQIVGTPPTYSGHALNAMTTATSSVAGTEQFGINAVQNNLLNVGVDPVQVPAGNTVYGVVNGNYALANQFMYRDGDVIAHSDMGTGQTNYTVSMIINVSNATPAGHYSSDFSAVVIPAY